MCANRQYHSRLHRSQHTLPHQHRCRSLEIMPFQDGHKLEDLRSTAELDKLAETFDFVDSQMTKWLMLLGKDLGSERHENFVALDNDVSRIQHEAWSPVRQQLWVKANSRMIRMKELEDFVRNPTEEL